VNDSNVNELDAGGMEFSLWLQRVGLCRPTGYRYRRDGKVVTFNIEGREFILTEEIIRFWQRVQAGEFAKKPRGASARPRRASSPPPSHAHSQDGPASAEPTTPLQKSRNECD
jgi:chromosome condensin MukBEF MukE localization factor